MALCVLSVQFVYRAERREGSWADVVQSVEQSPRVGDSFQFVEVAFLKENLTKNPLEGTYPQRKQVLRKTAKVGVKDLMADETIGS